MESTTVKLQKGLVNGSNLFKFICYSLIGIFMFFVPVTIGGKSTIPIDHLVTYITKLLGPAAPLYGLIVIVLGTLRPFVKKTWNKDTVTTIFSILKIMGLIIGFMAYFKIGPKWFLKKIWCHFFITSL